MRYTFKGFDTLKLYKVFRVAVRWKSLTKEFFEEKKKLLVLISLDLNLSSKLTVKAT